MSLYSSATWCNDRLMCWISRSRWSTRWFAACATCCWSDVKAWEGGKHGRKGDRQERE
jgi:hypothetical protein